MESCSLASAVRSISGRIDWRNASSPCSWTRWILSRAAPKSWANARSFQSSEYPSGTRVLACQRAWTDRRTPASQERVRIDSRVLSSRSLSSQPAPGFLSGNHSNALNFRASAYSNGSVGVAVQQEVWLPTQSMAGGERRLTGSGQPVRESAPQSNRFR